MWMRGRRVKRMMKAGSLRKDWHRQGKVCRHYSPLQTAWVVVMSEAGQRAACSRFRRDRRRRIAWQEVHRAMCQRVRQSQETLMPLCLLTATHQTPLQTAGQAKSHWVWAPHICYHTRPHWLKAAVGAAAAGAAAAGAAEPAAAQ
jgi:hypothetical protein